jgi:type III secretory pathway component EscV
MPGGGIMQFDITDQETEYLAELIETNYKELLVEINRSDTLEYKELLRDRLKVIDRLRAKINSRNT